MKIDTIIKWFMPREERFHVLLERDTQNLLRAARLFQEIANAPTLDERRVKTVQLKAPQHDGDQITPHGLQTLHPTLITPPDPGGNPPPGRGPHQHLGVPVKLALA